MQPPTSRRLPASGVAFFPLWTPTQNISNPTVMMFLTKLGSMLAV